MPASLKSLRALGALLIVFLAGCAAVGQHIRDMEIASERVLSAEQKPIPLELAYYMDFQHVNRTEAVGLPGGDNVRVHVGKALDAMMRENLGYAYKHITYLDSHLYNTKQWAFDYPGTVIVEIEEIAVNPANQSMKMSAVFSFFARGRRKVGEARIAEATTPINLDMDKLTEKERKIVSEGTPAERLELATSKTVARIVRRFFSVQPKLLKPVKYKDGFAFLSPFGLPQTIDFKPSSPNAVDGESLSAFRAAVAKLKQYPEIRVRIEVHAFDYLDKVYEFPPKILGPRRAEELKNAFIREGIDPGRLEVFSYEDAFPIANNKIEAGWDANDRVDLVVLGQ